MTRVVVAGAGGQLGRELLRADWSSGVEICPFTSAQLDISDRARVHAAITAARPHVVINAAAYTAVDRAEDEPERAMAVNGHAVGYLAEAADDSDALFIHISSDYVFDGSKSGWYLESDKPKPLGAYGRSKLVGEEAAAQAAKSVILRTAWVYGALGSNFVTSMLWLASERRELGVVSDQVGCPTAATDLAEAIMQLVVATDGGTTSTPSALYHLVSPEAASWHEFALAVFGVSSAGFDGICRELATDEYPTRAVRPANSRLDSSLIAHELGIGLPSWRSSLPSVVAELETARRDGQYA